MIRVKETESRINMSKKNKPIEVELVEGKNNQGDNVDLQVLIKGKEAGRLIKTVEDRFINIKLESGKELTATNVDEGLEKVIAEYNLYN